MISLSKQQVEQLITETSKKIGHKYHKGYKCENFVKDAYQSLGLGCDFKEFPILVQSDIYKEEWIGYLCFLRHKVHCPERRYTHVGIIAPNQSLLHYSRYFGEPNVREVFLTSFEAIFKVYNFAHPH